MYTYNPQQKFPAILLARAATLVMALIPPKIRQLIKPPPEEEAANALRWEIERAQRDQRRASERPLRRAVLELGPTVGDIDAAVDCACGCHPRPAQLETHDGGTTCPCQLTETQRRQRRDELFSAPWEPDPEEVELQRLRDIRFDEAVARLGVQAQVAVSAAPFVISGIVDGRAFYMRERHDHYRVTIAHDDNPLLDPWTSDAAIPTIDIAGGSEAEFYDDTATFRQDIALTITINSIRTYLLRHECPHETPTDHAHRFCRQCGIQLPDYSLFRSM
jgi:hypothetical protein